VARTGLLNIDHVNAFYMGNIMIEPDSFIDSTAPVGYANAD